MQLSYVTYILVATHGWAIKGQMLLQLLETWTRKRIMLRRPDPGFLHQHFYNLMLILYVISVCACVARQTARTLLVYMNPLNFHNN